MLPCPHKIRKMIREEIDRIGGAPFMQFTLTKDVIAESKVTFDDSTGHDHAGSGAAGTKIPEANVVFDTSAGHDHDGTDSKEILGLVPIGSTIAWDKTLTNTPALPSNFVECNGQTISDAASVYDGVTIRDLNGNNNFIRGNSTSGGTGGAATHNHQLLRDDPPGFYAADGVNVAATFEDIQGDQTGTGGYGKLNDVIGYTKQGSTLPPYINMVWIMRIK